MKEGASIILHLDCLSAVDCLTDEQAGALFKGLLRYANTGEPLLSPDSALQAVFALSAHKSIETRKNTRRNAERTERTHANAIRTRAMATQTLRSHAMACHRKRTHP